MSAETRRQARQQDDRAAGHVADDGAISGTEAQQVAGSAIQQARECYRLAFHPFEIQKQEEETAGGSMTSRAGPHSAGIQGSRSSRCSAIVHFRGLHSGLLGGYITKVYGSHLWRVDTLSCRNPADKDWWSPCDIQ